jgi:hypothetical protein
MKLMKWMIKVSDRIEEWLIKYDKEITAIDTFTVIGYFAASVIIILAIVIGIIILIV